MCGIVIWIGKNSNPVCSMKLAAAVNELKHRGPDGQRVFLCDRQASHSFAANESAKLANKRFPVGLAHSRLSIIDLNERSSQPISSPDGRYVLTFNGEIYNYKELADELRSYGVRLQTTSDSEVLLQLLIRKGQEAVKDLNGMWAFAFYDRVRGQMILSRDRFGKKPFFYYQDNQQFLAASEFKAIFRILGESHRKFNHRFLRSFVEDDWPTFDDYSTIYQGVYSVEPGAVTTIALKPWKVTTLRSETIPQLIHQDEKTPALRETIDSSIRLRLRSDVPTAILLSGGVDSSIVAGFARLAEQTDGQIHWYTGNTHFGKDLAFAHDVGESLGVNVHEIDVAGKGDALELFEKMTQQYEFPIRPNGNSIAMYQMYRAMAKDGVRVVLDGTGGDELFGGYFNRYAKHVVTDLIRSQGVESVTRFIDECELHEQFSGDQLRSHAKQIAERLLSGDSSNDGLESLFEKQFFDVVKGVLPRWLYMNDQNSMAHSIEARSPLLDRRLLSFVKAPAQRKFNNGFNKFMLRNAIPDNISDDVKWRRDKQGFRYNRRHEFRNHEDDLIALAKASPIVQKLFDAELSQIKELDPKKRFGLFAIAMLEKTNRERRSLERKTRRVA